MQKQPLYVVGRREPDLDSTVSAVVYAWLINRTRSGEKAIPISAGDIHPQARWLFETSGIALPAVKTDCRLKVGDFVSAAPQVTSHDPLHKALSQMMHYQSDVAVVVDRNGVVQGLISDRLPRTNYLLQCNIEDMIGSILNFNALIRGLDLQPLNDVGEVGEHNRIIVPAQDPQKLSTSITPEDVILTADYEALFQQLQKTRCAALVLADIEEEHARQVSQELKVPCFLYSGSLLSAISRLPGSFPCYAAMEESFIWLDSEAVLSDVRGQVARCPHAVPVMDECRRLTGILVQNRLVEIPAPRLCLVDHCHKSESIYGASEAEILEVLDHHRLGDVLTPGPMAIDCRPWGSTATIIADKISHSGVDLPPAYARLLLGAILDETRLLTSRTSTQIDRMAARDLARTANVDLDVFGMEVLRRNDSITTSPPADLVRTRIERQQKGSVTYFISHVETVDLSQVSENLDFNLRSAVERLRLDQGVEFGVLMITDIIHQFSRITIIGPDSTYAQQLVREEKRRDSVSWTEDSFVSPRKQLVPYINSRLKVDLNE